MGVAPAAAIGCTSRGNLYIAGCAPLSLKNPFPPSPRCPRPNNTRHVSASPTLKPECQLPALPRAPTGPHNRSHRARSPAAAPTASHHPIHAPHHPHQKSNPPIDASSSARKGLQDETFVPARRVASCLKLCASPPPLTTHCIPNVAPLTPLTNQLTSAKHSLLLKCASISTLCNSVS